MSNKGVEEMTDEPKTETLDPIVPMYREDVIRVLLLGAVTGVLVVLLAALLHRYVFDVYLCQGEVNDQCMNAKNYASGIAAFLVAIPALGALVRMRIYRPLLVILASSVAVWGVIQVALGLDWLSGLGIAAMLYALALCAFAWLARIRNFWISLAASLVLALVVRMILAV